MRKIIRLKKQEGIVLKSKIEYYDKELLQLVGKDGINEIIHDIELARKDRANGFIGYSSEEVINEMKMIVEEAMLTNIKSK